MQNLSITMAQNKYGKLIPKSANANIAIAIVNQATGQFFDITLCVKIKIIVFFSSFEKGTETKLH